MWFNCTLEGAEEMKIVKWILTGFGALIAFLVLLGCFVTVPAGHAGVVKRLGAVQPEHFTEGFHGKLPMVDSVEDIDIRLRKAESTASAASADLQVVETKVAVQYSLTADILPRAYQQIGNRGIIEATVIDPAIQESVKAVTAKYTAEELVTKRAEVKSLIQTAIDEFINTTLAQKEVPNAIIVANVAITDFLFTDEFNRAIEDKVKAEQEALKAENEKLRRVTQAEAAAAERTLAADAEAYQVEVTSKARAEAIRREAEALKGNEELIQLRLAESWDGQLPQVSGGNTIPLLNLESLK